MSRNKTHVFRNKKVQKAYEELAEEIEKNDVDISKLFGGGWG